MILPKPDVGVGYRYATTDLELGDDGVEEGGSDFDYKLSVYSVRCRAASVGDPADLAYRMCSDDVSGGDEVVGVPLQMEVSL